MNPWVSVDWLHAERANVIVVDTRWSLQGPDRASYDQGHIPGAYFADLDADLAGASGPGRHPLPSVEQFSALLSRIGAGASDTIVAYDAMGGGIAARLWWLLRYFGHDGGRILEGGYPAWLKSGGAQEAEAPPRQNAPPIPLSPRAELVVSIDEVNELRKDPTAVVLDARAAPRYRGDEEPIDPRAGHIPGARSAPFGATLKEGKLIDDESLHAHFDKLGALDAKHVVAYCGSGVTACHVLGTLSKLGRDDARLYVGSWSDWSSDPERPAQTGDQP